MNDVPRKGAVYRLENRCLVEGSPASAYPDTRMWESSFKVPWGSPALVLAVEEEPHPYGSGRYIALVLTSRGTGWLYDNWLHHCIVEPTPCAQ